MVLLLLLVAIVAKVDNACLKSGLCLNGIV